MIIFLATIGAVTVLFIILPFIAYLLGYIIGIIDDLNRRG